VSLKCTEKKTQQHRKGYSSIITPFESDEAFDRYQKKAKRVSAWHTRHIRMKGFLNLNDYIVSQ